MMPTYSKPLELESGEGIYDLESQTITKGIITLRKRLQIYI